MERDPGRVKRIGAESEGKILEVIGYVRKKIVGQPTFPVRTFVIALD